MTKIISIFYVALSTIAFTAMPAFAQNTKVLGSYHSWTALSYKDKGQVCSIFAPPHTHVEGGKRRGAVHAFFNHRKNQGDWFSVIMGYPIKQGHKPKVTIDGKSIFFLTSLDSSAFSYPDDDKKLLVAMKRGSTMVITSVSSRGTKTKDTYSLKGFSAAHKKANSACKS